MFGIFYLVVSTIGLTIGSIKNNISNANAKDYANQLYNEGKNRAHTYYDTEGNERDLTTNHKVFTYRNKDRDLIVKDLKTGKEVNIDKPIREAKYENAKQEAVLNAKKSNKVVPFGSFMEKEYRKTFLFCKDRYIDNRGNIYIKKYMIWNIETMELNNSNRIGGFYLNIKTNKIDYVDVMNAGEVYKHRSTCTPPYRSYDMLYANEEESKQYMEWYNKYLYNSKEEPLKYIGKFNIYDYKH